MTNKTDKPSKSPSVLVNDMHDNRGITFKYIKIDEAITYLEKHNNYFRLASYRKNFEKHQDPSKSEKYVELDFLHLKDLAIIDMYYRFIVIKMCSDIEHSISLEY